MKVDFDDRKILHNAELALVKAFSEFCRENNLKYFIMGGTFLGAVRHHGFIPWDDDIDVGMPRPDYERLQKLLAENGQVIGEYPFVTFKNSETTEYVARLENPATKIIDRSALDVDKRNSWMDVFPLDGMPNGSFSRNLHSFRLLTLRMLLKYSEFSKVSVNYTERPFVERTLIKVGKVLHPERWLNTQFYLHKLDKALQKYGYNESNYVINFMGAYKLKEMFPKKYYMDDKLYDFENLKL